MEKVACAPPLITEDSVYECSNCSRPVFSRYNEKKMTVDEFAAGVEEFLIFEKSYGVLVSTECVSFNGNMFSVATCCECAEELGYYLLHVRNPVRLKWVPNYFCVRGEKVKAMAQPRSAKLMEFVENRVQYVSSRIQKPILGMSYMTPAQQAVAVFAAAEVGKFVETGMAADDNVCHMVGNAVEEKSSSAQ